jgi:hypothetical protein
LTVYGLLYSQIVFSLLLGGRVAYMAGYDCSKRLDKVDTLHVERNELSGFSMGTGVGYVGKYPRVVQHIYLLRRP